MLARSDGACLQGVDATQQHFSPWSFHTLSSLAALSPPLLVTPAKLWRVEGGATRYCLTRASRPPPRTDQSLSR